MLSQGAGKVSGEAVDIAYEISCLLDTGLAKEELSILLALIENGVNPEVSFGPTMLQMLSKLAHLLICCA